MYCPACGAALETGSVFCTFCGRRLDDIGSSVHQQPMRLVPNKNKILAGILGILFGCFGVHKFYLGQAGWGVLYLLFCWTGIPPIAGLVEGIIYLTMNDEAFAQKYGGHLEPYYPSYPPYSPR